METKEIPWNSRPLLMLEGSGRRSTIEPILKEDSSMDRRKFTQVMGAAVAGMVAGSKAVSQTDSLLLADDAKKSKHVCKGRNECKGQGGCASGDNGCAGKNSCKGKGGCATVAKHACKGQNECKGQGGCTSGDNGCAGKNSCKSKGGCAVPLHGTEKKK